MAFFTCKNLFLYYNIKEMARKKKSNIKILTNNYNKTPKTNRDKINGVSFTNAKDIDFNNEELDTNINKNITFNDNEKNKSDELLANLEEKKEQDSIDSKFNDEKIISNENTKNEEMSQTLSLEEKSDKINEDKIEKIDDNVYLSEEIINEKIKGALEYQSPKQKRKSIIFSTCMLILNIVFMAFIIKNLFSEVEGNIFDVFINQGVKLYWLFGGVFAYIISIIMQIFLYKILLKNLSNNNNTFIAYDTAIVGRYYDNVTPFAIGGQPMQIVSLIKNNISPAVSTGIPLIKMVINTGMSAISALVFFVFGLPVLEMNSPLNKILLLVIEVLGVIGLVITLFITIFMFLISSGTLITRSFISGVLRIGYKLKLIKNYRYTYRKVLNQVAEYKFSIKYLFKNKKVLLKLVLVSFIENVAYAFIPFFVIMSFLTVPVDNMLFFMFICVTKYFLCSMASCFIPIPGGTGMMEISFIVLFGMILGDNIGWALIFWRFLSYYLVIAHGFIHELSKIISNLMKNKKIKNKV